MSIRLVVSSFYIILILLYIKFIYNDDNYDSLMMYFITLAVGRFIYFDFATDDFGHTLHGFWEELPLLYPDGKLLWIRLLVWILYRIPLRLTVGLSALLLASSVYGMCSIFGMDKTRVLRLVMGIIL